MTMVSITISASLVRHSSGPQHYRRRLYILVVEVREYARTDFVRAWSRLLLELVRFGVSDAKIVPCMSRPQTPHYTCDVPLTTALA